MKITIIEIGFKSGNIVRVPTPNLTEFDGTTIRWDKISDGDWNKIKKVYHGPLLKRVQFKDGNDYIAIVDEIDV